MEYHPVVNGSQHGSDGNGKGTVGTAAAIPDPVTQFPPPTEHPAVIQPRQGKFPLHFLTQEQIDTFDATGVLVLKAAQVWTDAELKLLLAAVNLMDQWKDRPGKYMKYYESKKSVDGVVQGKEKMVSRIENFCEYNPGLDFLLNGDKLVGMCSELFDEQAILYKEKINYKLSGGDGFAPHQDVAAGWWMYGQSLHISTLVCVDAATAENGCLEVSLGEHVKGMISPPWKEVPLDVVERLKWVSCPTAPGDVIFFDSFVPHKSGPNRTHASRRVLYATYAKAAEGDFRKRYYADKRLSYPPDCERDPAKNYEYKI